MSAAEVIITVVLAGFAQSVAVALFIAGRLGKRLDSIDTRLTTQTDRMGQMSAEVAVLRTHVDYLRPIFHHHFGDADR